MCSIESIKKVTPHEQGSMVDHQGIEPCGGCARLVYSQPPLHRGLMIVVDAPGVEPGFPR